MFPRFKILCDSLGKALELLLNKCLAVARRAAPCMHRQAPRASGQQLPSTAAGKNIEI